MLDIFKIYFGFIRILIYKKKYIYYIKKFIIFFVIQFNPINLSTKTIFTL